MANATFSSPGAGHVRRRLAACLRIAAPVLLDLVLSIGAFAQGYTHFEARHVHPIELSPDGTRLFAVNSPDGRVSVFDVTHATNAKPLLVGEIPAGIEPVSVRARTNDELWVVNEVSDTVSIVSVSKGVVIDTLRTSDEPADVAFANGKAFVTCARNNLVRVFDATTRAAVATIPLQGLYPRNLVVNPNGTRVYAIFQLSGNRTTTLPAAQAPPPPAPTNPSLPPAPQTGLIVSASDSRIKYTVLDNDVVEIDASTNTVLRYFTNVSTNLLGVAVRPTGGELWVASTDARNVVRFEPNVRGRTVENRLSRITISSGASTAFDLNPGVDYNILPNPTAQANALAQPMAVLFAPSGTEMWVAAFGSDRVAKINTSGAIQARIDVRAPSGGGENGSRKMRGPRGLALDSARSRLYVLNKLSNTISVLSTTSNSVITEVPAGSFDPMPPAIKEGRGFLFDARISGNGTMSCATCHIDADRDGLAWDLGDPGGEMTYVMGLNNAAHETTPIQRALHPMKGPMVTQTLRGMQGGAPFHWRGDRPSLHDFNPAFKGLVGGDAPLPQADMDSLVAYLQTLVNHPNPNRNFDNTLPTLLNGGNAVLGRQKFLRHDNHCTFCHADPKGTDNNLDDRRLVNNADNIKNAPLQTTYQRNFFKPTAGATTVTGFGMNHDGTGGFLPVVHFYELDLLEGQDFADVEAYVLSFDSGTFPAVSLSRTVNPGNAANSTVLSEISLLENQVALGRTGLVVQGVIGGVRRSFRFDLVTRRYVPDSANEPSLTRADLLALLGAEDAVTFSGVTTGEANRRGGDRNGNGVPDRDEPAPIPRIHRIAGGARVDWSRLSPGWLMESAPAANGPWQRANQAPQEDASAFFHDIDFNGAQSSFFRLRRTW